jgi:hypothetical protein
MSWNLDGNTAALPTRDIATWPSSSGCRSASRVARSNSGNSSRNRTPSFDGIKQYTRQRSARLRGVETGARYGLARVYAGKTSRKVGGASSGRRDGVIR